MVDVLVGERLEVRVLLADHELDGVDEDDTDEEAVDTAE